MKDFFHLLFFQLKTVMYSWKTALALCLVPMLFFAGIGVIFSKLLLEESHVQLFEVALVDEDQTMETKYVIKQLLNSSHLTKVTKVRQVEKAEAEVLMEKNKAAAMIVLPKGFSEDIKSGINTPVEVIGNGRRPLQAQLVRHVMESAAKLTSAAQSGINTVDYFLETEQASDKVRHAEFKKSFLSFSFHILGRGELFDVKAKKSLFQQDIRSYYTLSLYVLLVMFWSFGFILFFRGKTSGALGRRLHSRGITPGKEKVAGAGAAAVCVAVASCLVSIPLMNGLPNGDILAIILIILAFFTFFMLLDALLVPDTLFLMFGIAFILVGAIAGGHFLPAVYFPEWLVQLGRLTINSWALELMLSPDSAMHSIKVLSVSTSLCLLLTMFILKVFKRRWE